MEGNQMKMRDALRKITELFRDIDLTIDCPENEAYLIAASALSAPPRNCDVGTPDEQDRRRIAYCRDHSCKICPLRDSEHGGVSCDITWAQTPYEAENGEGDGK